MSAHTEATSTSGTFKYSLESGDGKTEGAIKNVTPDQGRQIIAVLKGTLKETRPAYSDLLAAVAAFIKYDNDDQSDGAAAMLNYADAIEKARAAFAKAGVTA
jgi:hypothetical protein